MLEQEATALLRNRTLMVRRGRNNRIFHKFILNDIFEEKVDDELDEMNSKNILGKRNRCKFDDPMEFFLNQRLQNNRVAQN